MWFCFWAFLFHSIGHLFYCLIVAELRTSPGSWSSKSPSLFFCLLFIASFSTVSTAKASSNTWRFRSFSCMLSAPRSPRQGGGWMTSLAPLQGHQQVHAVTLLRILGDSRNHAGRLCLSQLILTENKTPKQQQPRQKQIKISELDTWGWFIWKEFRQLVCTIEEWVCAGIHIGTNFTSMWIDALYPFYS